MHCINFFIALINALLMHPDPSKEKVGEKLVRAPRHLGGHACRMQKVKKQIETYCSTITDVTASIEIY